MATRAPKGAPRPSGGTAGRTRPAGSAGRSGGGSVRSGAGSSSGRAGTGKGGTARSSTAKSSTAKSSTAKNGAGRGSSGRAGASAGRGGTPYYRSRGKASQPRLSLAGGLRASSNPFLILTGWVLSGVAAVWMEVAGGVGYVARLFGASARGLDPAHRRDGAGLAVLAGAIFAAGTAWWHLGSPLGRALTAFVRGAFGVGSWLIPVLLALLAFRLLRHPDKNAHTGRMVIGWTALLLGALGIVHIALGSPSPGARDGVTAMQSSGGLLGWAISAPLQALLTTWAAIPLLALLAAFGVLVITGTPLHRVPERFHEVMFLLRGGSLGATQEYAEDDELLGESPDQRLGKRKSTGAIEAGENHKPYDTPLLGGLVPRGSAGRPARPGQAAAPGTEPAAQAGVPANRSADDEVLAEALMFGSSEDGPHGPGEAGLDGYGSAGRPGAAAGAEAKWRKSWFGADDDAPGTAAGSAAAVRVAARTSRSSAKERRTSRSSTTMPKPLIFSRNPARSE